MKTTMPESERAAMNQTTLEVTSDREMFITRTFNAPPRIVFDAWTRADLVARWWAPKSLGVSIVSCEADVREGGTYRYVLNVRDANTMAFSGTYAEVTPPSRVVYTQTFEPTASGPEPDAAELIVTVTFEERNGKTHVVSHTLCPSKQVLDDMLATGMEHGMRETMDQLDQLVASLH